MKFSLWWLVLAACSFVCLAASLPTLDEDDGVIEMVSRIKGHSGEEIHGYSLAVMHAEDPDSGNMRRLTKRDVLVHASYPSAASRHFTLELLSGHSIHMALSKRTITIPGTTIIERQSDNQNVHHQVPADCFFAGPVKDGFGHAVLSLCEGDMMGSVEGDNRRYEIHTLPTDIAERHRRSSKSSAEPVLVTWRNFLGPQMHKSDAQDNPAANGQDDSPSDNGPGDEGPDEHDPGDGELDTKDDNGGSDPDGEDDIMATPTTLCSGYRRRRRALEDKFKRLVHPIRRNPADRNPIVEIAAIMDKDYTEENSPRASGNISAWLIRLAVLKWTGVASVYADPILGFNITVRLVHLEVWRHTPTWYDGKNMTDRLLDVMYNRQDIIADHLALWTANCILNEALGSTQTDGICNDQKRGSVQLSSNNGYRVETHELGHNLGLEHEWNIKECNNTGPAGFMGYTRNYRCKACYAKQLAKTFTSKNCLYKESYRGKDSLTSERLTGGQALGFDGQCEFHFGKGFKYFHTDVNICRHYTCIATNGSTTSDRTLVWGRVLPGTVCRPQHYCVRGRCLSVTHTAYVGVPKRNTIVDGGWGPWSAPSECSSSVAGAASLTLSKRQCNSPEPQNGAYCVGNVYKAELCSAQEKRPASRVNAQQLAEEICREERDKDKSCSPRGMVNAVRRGMGSCSVRCKIHETIGKIAFMLPDGVPCKDSDGDVARGITKLCVQGRCMAFGCNGKTMGDAGGMTRDRCGVCGGSGNDC